MQNSIAITGAGSGVGEALAGALSVFVNLDSRLVGGRRADKLQAVGNDVSAREVIPGNLFAPGSPAHAAMMQSHDRIIAHLAAINLDTHPDESQREPLREAQNAFLVRLLETLKRNDPKNPRLLIAMNSVTAFFARENPRAQRFPYMLMKMQQADILSKARAELSAAGIELAVVYPGAIFTEMMAHMTEEEAIRGANLFGKRTKNAPGHPSGLIQDRVFEAYEIASVLANLINFYLANDALQEEQRELVIASSADLPL